MRPCSFFLGMEVMGGEVTGGILEIQLVKAWWNEQERKLEERLAREHREFKEELRERQAMAEADNEAWELRNMSRPAWWR